MEKKKKYKLTGETIEINGKTLHRIEALRNFVGVRKGDKGGFVESEENLSHLGNCWIYDNACVFEKAVVFNDAIVYFKARVCGNAQVFGKAVVASRAEVSGNAQVFEHAWLHGDAKVSGNAEVSGHARVGGNAEINCIALDVKLSANVWHDASEEPRC